MNFSLFLSEKLSQSSADFFYTGLFFVIYLGGVVGACTLITIGSLKRDDWILVFTPTLYYALIPLHGEFHDADVDLLWGLTFQWTPPAIALGCIIGSVIKKTSRKRRDQPELERALEDDMNE